MCIYQGCGFTKSKKEANMLEAIAGARIVRING